MNDNISESKQKIVNDFYSEAEPYAANLFNYLSDVYFFVKDREHRFVKVNSNFLKLFGFTAEEEVIGLTDYDMVSRELAIKYERDDNQIMESGIPVYEKKEPVSSVNDIVSLHITTKLPVYNVQREIIGLVGITRDVAKTQIAIKPLQDLQKAVEAIEKDFSKSLKVDDLASMVNMSTSTFLRHFKKHFHIPPVQYIKQVRLSAACRMLLETDKSFCDIAYETGFCDQSYMTREFKKMTELSPSEYRKKYFT
jgi:PAS domain S-box-containing protein